jgi:hypothetical protein
MIGGVKMEVGQDKVGRNGTRQGETGQERAGRESGAAGGGFI